ACSGFFARCRQSDADTLLTLTTRKVAISRIRLALLIFPTFTISQPSTHVACTQPLFLLSLGGKIFNHFAETFDSGWIVDLLPENHGGGRDANDFAVENFVSNLEKVTSVIGTIDHPDQTLLLRADDTLKLDFVDEESRRSGRTLARRDL